MKKDIKKKKRQRSVPREKQILTQGPTTAKLKARLDDRTVVTLHHISALKLWKAKYPKAYIIDNEAA